MAEGKMKKRLKSLFTILLLLFTVATVGKIFWKDSSFQRTFTPPVGISAVVAHATQRCTVCTSMERWVQEVLRDDFSEIPISFCTLNYEAPENQTFAEEHRIAAAVLLIENWEGAERLTRIENLAAEAWDAVGDEKVFKEMIRTRIRRFLNKTSSAETLEVGTDEEISSDLLEKLDAGPNEWKE